MRVLLSVAASYIVSNAIAGSLGQVLFNRRSVLSPIDAAPSGDGEGFAPRDNFGDQASSLGELMAVSAEGLIETFGSSTTDDDDRSSRNVLDYRRFARLKGDGAFPDGGDFVHQDAARWETLGPGHSLCNAAPCDMEACGGLPGDLCPGTTL